ncbi:MAG: indole-3-glycerol phosphate synthase TrpC [Bacteroidales bacterium]|nr:indole-3-glycerol phosphate synthase TrpC [Bacteroidales bacterium]
MQDILESIVEHKRREIAHYREIMPASDLYPKAEALDLSVMGGSMKEKLLGSSTGIIAEFKRRSPSKGWIKKEADASSVPLGYQRQGAAALSILTDREFFGGDDQDILAARQSGLSLPVLYKNFVIDEYQLYMARLCGASAVLLIAACLSLEECRALCRKARQLGLEVLLEMHGENELAYAELEPDMYGINNRHLGTFTTDVNTSFRLAGKLPVSGCKVSESGLSSPQTVKELRQAGFRGFLMGEHFMKAPDPELALAGFIKEYGHL